MISALHIIAVTALLTIAGHCPAHDAPNAAPEADYGNNTQSGRLVELNGIALYVETYGQGQPLLLIHANAGNIASMAAQISHFARNRRVIAVDSRGHGRSGLGKPPLTYEQMAKDYNALLDTLEIQRVDIVGWSDGGIIALLLAISHPEKVNRLAIMGANLRPDGAYPWAVAWVADQRQAIEGIIASGDTSQPWHTFREWFRLLGDQPNIEKSKVAGIRAPTLVMAGDRDVIRDDHTLEIFHALPNAQLAIFPGATHGIPSEDPERFNATVERFLSNPFKMPDTRNMLLGGEDPH